MFPGESGQLSVMRRWLEVMVPDGEVRDDLTSVATELASNAIRHTRSGRGGSFAVEVTLSQQAVRVAVTDKGAPDGPRLVEDPDGESGRGLLLVRALAVRTGIHGDQRSRMVWAELAWPAGQLPAPTGGTLTGMGTFVVDQPSEPFSGRGAGAERRASA